ncbi:alpha/beta fold hydrolase [Catelliglobosispora koreensis]|uniref:alpha/beta fold hydrolase n=1 Tax=Catelliglobosispora koreensis TaxID=129052 RepID=UPI00037DF879|nr:alpha/beta hydrolase [Catelliglobosispora koreensis]
MLEIPDGQLHYEVRGDGPLIALIAAPMDASSFQPLAELLAPNYTVLTTDPRGINRSRLNDPSRDSTPELRAEDLSRLLTHLGRGPAVVLGSSGGAVTALAHAQAYPNQVHTVIAHEPPFYSLLEDREERMAGAEDIIATFKAGDIGGAWFKFLVNANIQLSEEEMASMAPAEPDPQHNADQHYSFVHMLRGTVAWEPDLQKLRSGTPKIVVGIGESSIGQLCDRVSRALARELNTSPAMFPGGHLGFLEKPEAFAVRLRDLLQV